MRRREFIACLGGAAAWPLAARAQPAKKPLIGFLCGKTPDADAPQLAAAWKGLNELGFTAANTVAKYRWAQNQYDRFPSEAAALVALHVDVIVAIGTTPAALAAKAATQTIPIIFVVGTDPVRVGLVPSFNRPGGNVTGVSFLNRNLVAKQMQFLHEMVPHGTTFGFLVNPKNPFAEADQRDAHSAVDQLGVKLAISVSSNENELSRALDSLVAAKVDGLIVAGDLFLDSRHDQLIAFAARRSLPTIYPWPEVAAAGGLMSYGASRNEAYRLAGIYAGRVLKGEKAADLPVQQSTKIELVINIKAARVLGITFPLQLLGRADEVIE